MSGTAGFSLQLSFVTYLDGLGVRCPVLLSPFRFFFFETLILLGARWVRGCFYDCS